MRKLDSFSRDEGSAKVFRFELYGLALLAVLWMLFGCSKKQDLSPTQLVDRPPQQQQPASNEAPPPAAVPAAVEEAILKHHLYTYPEITVLLAVKDAQRTAEL